MMRAVASVRKYGRSNGVPLGEPRLTVAIELASMLDDLRESPTAESVDLRVKIARELRLTIDRLDVWIKQRDLAVVPEPETGYDLKAVGAWLDDKS